VQFEIIVDGISRSFRDNKAIALEAAYFFKERHPTLAVSVRDLLDGTRVDIGKEALPWNASISMSIPTAHSKKTEKAAN
jgi:hypothetical protein